MASIVEVLAQLMKDMLHPNPTEVRHKAELKKGGSMAR
jgi:hypothetical protein